MKKKVIALVVDTDLTNEELEQGNVTLLVQRDPKRSREVLPPPKRHSARNVRVLDADS